MLNELQSLCQILQISSHNVFVFIIQSNDFKPDLDIIDLIGRIDSLIGDLSEIIEKAQTLKDLEGEL